MIIQASNIDRFCRHSFQINDRISLSCRRGGGLSPPDGSPQGAPLHVCLVGAGLKPARKTPHLSTDYADNTARGTVDRLRDTGKPNLNLDRVYLSLSAFICGYLSACQIHPQNEFWGATRLVDGGADILLCHSRASAGHGIAASLHPLYCGAGILPARLPTRTSALPAVGRGTASPLRFAPFADKNDKNVFETEVYDLQPGNRQLA